MTKGKKKKKKTMKPIGPPSGPPTGPSTPSSKTTSKVKVEGKESVTKKTEIARSPKEERLEELYSELAKQKAIFEANKHRAIDPDGSKEYWKAKRKFDGADRRIKKIEKEIAHLLTVVRKANIPPGTQIKPSQSKTK